jgi:vancomycin resistance protein VanJ
MVHSDAPPGDGSGQDVSPPAVRLPPVAVVCAACAVALLAMSGLHAVAPARSGPIALTEVFAPHLFLPLLVVVPLAIRARTRWLTVPVFGALLIGAVRFGPGIVSFGDPEGTPDLIVVSWNLEEGGTDPQAVGAVLRSSEADIVALQEVTPPVAQALEADGVLSDRFPYQVVRPESSPWGMAVLSRYPIRDVVAIADPVAIRSEVEVPGGPIILVNAHPLRARVAPVGSLAIPTDFDAVARDASFERLRELIDAGEDGHALLVGDFNVTDREPGYRDLSSGLVDAHAEVGQGPGSSWRPGPLKGLPVGILRIDYLFSSESVRPVAVLTDCTPRGGDHCLLRGSFAFE